MHLLDTNVWLALAFAAHQHHISAKFWFDALPDDRRCYFCRFTQQGFLRLANNPNLFPGIAVTQAEAWSMYDAFHNDPRVEFADEPPSLETIWRQLTQRPTFSSKSLSDAYLVAFAQAAGLELVSFDKGFAQYTSARHTILSGPGK
jgi:hypothetical protein